MKKISSYKKKNIKIHPATFPALAKKPSLPYLARSYTHFAREVGSSLSRSRDAGKRGNLLLCSRRASRSSFLFFFFVRDVIDTSRSYTRRGGTLMKRRRDLVVAAVYMYRRGMGESISIRGGSFIYRPFRVSAPLFLSLLGKCLT